MLLNCGVGEDTKSPLDCKEIKPILKEIIPEYSLEGLMLKLELQYFGHLIQRTDSLEKILMLGKTEGRRRMRRQRMRWLGGWHHRLDELECEQAPGLVCCSLWGWRELDMTEQLNSVPLSIFLNMWEQGWKRWATFASGASTLLNAKMGTEKNCQWFLKCVCHFWLQGQQDGGKNERRKGDRETTDMHQGEKGDFSFKVWQCEKKVQELWDRVKWGFDFRMLKVRSGTIS